MRLLSNEGMILVFASILSVYLLAIIAISPPEIKSHLNSQSQANEVIRSAEITLPPGAVLHIQNGTFSHREDKKEEPFFSGTQIVTLITLFFGGLITWITHRFQESRLRVEALNKSVELLKERKDETVGPVERGAMIFSLMNLGQDDYALEMLRTFWPKGQITSTAAVWCINRIFTTSKDNDLKDYAAMALWENANRLVHETDGFEWPSAFEWRWTNELSPYARRCVLVAMLYMLTSRPRHAWQKRWFDSLLETLEAARMNDADTLNKYRAAKIEQALLIRYSYAGGVVHLENGRISAVELLASLNSTLKLASDDKLPESFLDGLLVLNSEAWNAQAPLVVVSNPVFQAPEISTHV